MQKRFLCLLVVLFFVGAVAFGQTLNYSTFKPTKQLTIQVMNNLGPWTKPAANDVVTPILREKTGVKADIIPTTRGFTGDEATITALIAGNNLPDVFGGDYITPKAIVQQLLLDNDAVWDFADEATFREYFPNLSKRIDQWGDFKIYWENSASYGGTHVAPTTSIPWLALGKYVPATKTTTFYARNAGKGGYSKWLRDDILRKIFPKARSAAQQEQFFVNTFNYSNPTGASDPYGDIPINSIEQFYDYMKKAKEIIDKEDLMDGLGKDKMIVAQIDAFIGWGPGLWPTNLSMYGYWWEEPWHWKVADKMYYGPAEPWTYDALKWMNKWYNEGLLDPEAYVTKDADVKAQCAVGRYAIFPNWPGFDVDAATKLSKEKKLGWGFRNLLCWWPRTFKMPYEDSINRWVSYYNKGACHMISKNIKREDLAQVANWIDYHTSEEYQLLHTWGPSSFYTGTGKDRRYKPAYKDLENFQAYGVVKEGAKDGYYYNITWDSPATLDAATGNYETDMGQFTNYYLAPQYVYPAVKKTGMNYEREMWDALVGYYTTKAGVNYYPQIGWTEFDLSGIPNFSKIEFIWCNPSTEIIKAVVDKPENFEKNYAAYMKFWRDPEVAGAIQDLQLKWKEIFEDHVKKYWKY